ncbi:MAG: FtsX-like permease family protein [Gemmatimonadetes bacterium]|nr:FtsX-like permease family protein [Gemmatimonadota bacterium]
MGHLLTDLRHGARRLLRTPTATLTVWAALSIGIGLPTLLYSLIDGALLPTLPFEGGERFVRVRREGFAPISTEDYLHWSARQRSFEGLGAVADGMVTLGIEGAGVEAVMGSAMDLASLRLLSVQPALGRTFTDGDVVPGAPAVALIGHAVWRDRLGADPRALGRTVRVDGKPTVIVGVMPEGFGFPHFSELWTPLRMDPAAPPRRGDFGEAGGVFGVLKEGIGRGTAASELDALDAQRIRPAAEAKPAPVVVKPFTNIFGQPEMAAVVGGLMLGVAFLVLLVACANATNVLLARATVRRREVAIRAALGASRARIAAGFWTEVSLLAVAGALGGVLIAQVGGHLVRGAMPRTGMPFWIDVRVDFSVLAFLVAAAVLAAFLAGVMPAVHASRANRHELLKDTSRGSSSRHLGRTMGRLIGAEIAVSFVLLVAAGLFVRSAVNVRAFDYTFAPEGVYTARIGLPEPTYPEAAAQAAFAERLAEALAGTPGVASMTLTSQLPGVAAPEGRVAVEGTHDPSAPDLPRVGLVIATPGFFETFQARMTSGRAFDAGDRSGSLPVAIVNTACERKHVPGGALGRRIAFASRTGEEEWLTIVGVAPDLLPGGHERDATQEAVYLPLAQAPQAGFYVVARPSDRSIELAEPIREAVARRDPDVALFLVQPLDLVLYQANAQFAWLSALFLTSGALALFLAAIGLYGVMAFWVAQRTREIGVRMALGGERRQIVGLVLREGMMPTFIGLAAGGGVAIPVGWLLGAFTFGVAGYDPLVFGSVLGVLLSAGWLGCWIPVLRATRVDPLAALAAD